MSGGDRRAMSAYRIRAATAGGAMLGGTLLMSATLGIAGAISDGTGADTIPVAAPRVVVVKAARMLHLFDGDHLVRTYPVDLGVVPVGTKWRRHDGRTPVGEFRVVTRNADSPYHRFIGIDYPDVDAVESGLAHGLISEGEATSIRRALKAGRCPDWTTALGGGIGIHGHRIGRDWTGGCIALSDEHVEELFDVLRIGDPVEILP